MIVKNYSDINAAVADLETTKSQFQHLHCIFYTTLFQQLEEVLQIPEKYFVKFEHNDHEKTETLDDCVGIEDIYAKAKIGIVFKDNLTHIVMFKSHKIAIQKFCLCVECRNDQRSFEFKIEDEDQIHNLDFREVISFISSSIEKFYHQWTSRFNINSI